MRPVLLTVGACAVAVLGWYAGGWIADFAGLAALDLPARAAGMFLALALAEFGQGLILKGQH